MTGTGRLGSHKEDHWRDPTMVPRERGRRFGMWLHHLDCYSKLNLSKLGEVLKQKVNSCFESYNNH